MSKNAPRKRGQGGDRDPAAAPARQSPGGETERSLTVFIKSPLLALHQAGWPHLPASGSPPPQRYLSSEAHIQAGLSQLKFLLKMFSYVYFHRGDGNRRGSPKDLFFFFQKKDYSIHKAWRKGRGKASASVTTEQIKISSFNQLLMARLSRVGPGTRRTSQRKHAADVSLSYNKGCSKQWDQNTAKARETGAAPGSWWPPPPRFNPLNRIVLLAFVLII